MHTRARAMNGSPAFVVLGLRGPPSSHGHCAVPVTWRDVRVHAHILSKQLIDRTVILPIEVNTPASVRNCDESWAEAVTILVGLNPPGASLRVINRRSAI